MFDKKWLGFFPLYDITDGGGGGGEGTGSEGVAADTSAEPAVVDIPGDDALVKYPGAEKPVKFKEIRNFQAQWTREAQRRAEIERKLQEREAQIQRYEQERQRAARQPQQSGQPDVFEALRQLPYLDGETAVGVVQGIQREIAMRDQAMLMMAQQMRKMQQQFGSIHENHSNAAFDAKINKWLTEGGYPQEYADLAKEVYLAYEGDDLDYEFPQIFAERVSQIEKAIEAKRAREIAAQRQNRFVPGKGGQVGPSKPLTFKGNESPKEITDALFSLMHEPGT